MLPGVIQVDDLNRAGEMLLSQVPNPFGAIADHDFLLCSAPAAFPRFDVKAPPELFGSLNRAGVGSGVGVANRIALFVPGGLGECASELGFARMCGLSLPFSLAPLSLLVHHR